MEVYVRKPVESRIFRLGNRYFLLLRTEGKEHYIMFEHGENPSAHVINENMERELANAQILENGTFQIKHKHLMIHLAPEELKRAKQIPEKYKEKPWEYIGQQAGSFTKIKDRSFFNILKETFRLLKELSGRV